MADNDDPGFDVDIRLRSDTRGAEDAKRKLREVADEADKAGTRGASGFGRLVTGGRAGSAAVRGLSNVMKGGAAAAGGLAQILNDLFLVVRSAAASAGPFALLALAIGIVIGVMRGLAHGTSAASKELKDAEKSADAAAKANLKLGEAWGQREVKAFTDELREMNRVLAVSEERMHAVFKIAGELRHEATKQQVLGLELSEAQAQTKLAKDIGVIENDRALPPEEKARRIATLRRENEDNSLRNKERIRAAQFGGEAADEHARITELSAEQANNTARARAARNRYDEEVITTGVRLDSLKQARAKLSLVAEARDLRAKIEREEQEKLVVEALSGETDPEGRHRSATDRSRLAQIPTDKLPSSDQLVAVIAQLIGEIDALNKNLPGLKDAADTAEKVATGKNQTLDVEKAGIKGALLAKGNTAVAEANLDRERTAPQHMAEFSAAFRQVNDDQAKMAGLTGDALTSQQITTNKHVDVLQSIVSRNKYTDRQLDEMKRQILNSASTQ